MGFGIGLGPRLFRVRVSTRGVRVSSGVGPFWASTGTSRRRRSRRARRSHSTTSDASGCLPLLAVLLALATVYWVAAWPYQLMHHIAIANGASKGSAKTVAWVIEAVYLIVLLGAGALVAKARLGNRRSSVVPTQSGIEPTAASRPTRPDIGGGRPITEYSQHQLVDLVRWIESDGSARTHDELLTTAVAELGFRRRGSRIVAALENAIATAHR